MWDCWYSSQQSCSNLWFIQPGILNDVLCKDVKYVGWQYTALMYSFLKFEPVRCSMSGSNCCFLSVYRFLRRQVRWAGIPASKYFPQFVVIHTVKGFSLVSEAEIGVVLELPFFSCDPIDVGNLTSGSSAFSKSSLNIWNFSVHVLLKPSLKDFELYLASMWNEHNCMVAWTFFDIAFLWDWNENWPFAALWPPLSFPNLLAYWVQHFNSIIF